MKINKKEIGARIKAARADAGLQQNDLAKKAGLAQSTLSEIISGSRVTSVENLTKIASALDLSLDYLITGQERPQKVPQQTKEDALRLVLTSDPQLVEKIKDDLRHQIQEETPAYQFRHTSNETRLLKAFALLDARRQERLIDTAEDMSVALLRGSGQEEAGRGTNCAGSNDK